MKKFAVHPGVVVSSYDGEIHYIGSGQLANLYGLNQGDYIIWDLKRPKTYKSRNWKDYIHLYVRGDGNYCKVMGEILDKIKDSKETKKKTNLR